MVLFLIKVIAVCIILFKCINTSSAETLLHFSFANFLVNPCGLMVPPADGGPYVSPSNPDWPGIETAMPYSAPSFLPKIRTYSKDGALLIRQASEFISHFKTVFHKIRNESRKRTVEERASLSREFHKTLVVGKHLAQHVYLPSTLRKCEGMQLQSLLPEPVPLSPETGDLLLLEIYRGLLISAAHLHLMIFDVYESTHFCPAENRPQHHQTIRHLTGKMETLMCLMLQSATGPENYDILNFYNVTKTSIKSKIYRYNDCSAREVRGCLVIHHINQILKNAETLTNITKQH